MSVCLALHGDRSDGVGQCVEIERVQLVGGRRAVHVGDDIQPVRRSVDNRRAVDPHIGAVVAAAERRGHGRAEIALHQHLPRTCIERIDRVAFSSHVQHIVHRPGDSQRRHQERLSVDLVIERDRGDYAEVRREGGRRQHRFRLVPAATQIVVVLGPHGELRSDCGGGPGTYEQPTNEKSPGAMELVHGIPCAVRARGPSGRG